MFKKSVLIPVLFITACTVNNDRWTKITTTEQGCSVYGDNLSYSSKEHSAWLKIDYSSIDRKIDGKKVNEILYMTKADCEKRRMKFLSAKAIFFDKSSITENDFNYRYPSPGSPQETAMNWLCR